jgi:UDP-N-acetylglucosamine--N-acetylmuramyl-(pentapeptide) pyrophosphoryl-undecaprenol N-acetylglucosamine transferase
VAAGGTGGHLFPAEALAAALAKRDIAVALATDSRAALQRRFRRARARHSERDHARARSDLVLAQTAGTLAYGVMKALLLYGRLKPASWSASAATRPCRRSCGDAARESRR